LRNIWGQNLSTNGEIAPSAHPPYRVAAGATWDNEQAKDWSQLEALEPSTAGSTATRQEATAATPKTTAAANLPPGNTHSADGIATALARRSAVNHVRATLKRAFVFPEDQLRPISYQWPASYGEPTSVYPGVLHGIPYNSYHFENAPNVKRATVPVQGYDD
jgi:hypothetical protein